ncbi:cysteine desulfurase family protein [Dyella sp. GSA-30]|uniref:cysteine desulfurase family protein n=1 Tax=Dyella sp. GSA-30 TaxID=2994496 RepID=UPI002491561F|nr:cysteine desulfurase family protein [Dyella sp. GSA-30]BDU22917.1 cysteine desulfurase IscS [Dyella sp. GSA-30]
MASPIYLDFNASAPPDPEVVDAMLPWLSDRHANPHSEHFHGHRAAVAVEQAKAAIASLIGADGDDLVLTSSATESNNLALLGYLRHRKATGALIHSAIEHKCVMEAGQALRDEGCAVSVVAPDGQGRILPEAIRNLVEANDRPDLLVSVMHANNELGTVAPLAQIAAELGRGAILHTDAAQSAGRMPFDVSELQVDVVTLSSHKIGGPGGIAALYIAPDLRSEFRPILYGGGQQGGLRSGTVPVFLAVGYGVACQLAERRLAADRLHVEQLATHFTDILRARGVAFERLGDPDHTLPGLRSLRLLGLDARDVLDRCRNALSASTGSACTSGEITASHVLRAIGLSEQTAAGVLRVGFGRQTTLTEVTVAAAGLAEACVAAQA